MPGLETRLPLMFNAMVNERRMSVEHFVELTATAPARAFGLQNKGQIAPGYDADLALWDIRRAQTYGANDLHDNVGYNPFEGVEVLGMPVTVLSRGSVIVRDRRLQAVAGQGAWLPMSPPA